MSERRRRDTQPREHTALPSVATSGQTGGQAAGPAQHGFPPYTATAA
jgi:hypothetical protein